MNETSVGRQPDSKKSYDTELKCLDGNGAVAHAAYRTNDCAFIYPITPSTPMSEEVNQWASVHKKNLFGQEMKVIEMQSESGAAGALHGALVSGVLATTFTASQGLLLFVPNLYKISGELLPTVIHISSRALAGEALSIYGDHSDMMMVRGCGAAMISSFSVQEAHDMAVISQISTLNSRIPFLHFMDGFRTSHEINKIEICSDKQLEDLIPYDKVKEHRDRAMSPMHPTQRGTAQSPDVFMQLVESSNKYYIEVIGHILNAFQDFETVTGRKYNPFEYNYYGSTKPQVAIITMGSSVVVCDQTLKNLKSEQACVIGVRMFRPWNSKLFASCVPPSIKRIAVLDRTREGGSQGEPLYLDVCTSLMIEGRGNIFVAGGRYGLGSKDFTPRMVRAVIYNILRKEESEVQRPFTVGITDDVTNLSLSLGRTLNILDKGKITQCVFWGFGSDGTIGANKEAIKMIGNYHPKMSVQAYFEYDAKKSSGWTISHLRFSHIANIQAPYRIEEGQADYVACHNEGYVQANKFDVIKYLNRRGIFFLNTTVASIADPQERIKALESLISSKILCKLALRNIKFYIMDAAKLALKFGLAGRINMVCMCVFFRLAGVIPLQDAIALLKTAIVKKYSYKGDDIVQKNINLLDTVVNNPTILVKVDIPDTWRTISDAKQYLGRHLTLIQDEKARKFMDDIGNPVTRLEGDDIPISKFLENNLLGGVMIPGTTKFEKRLPNPSRLIPEWDVEKCTQCNLCAFVCPHAAIRPFIVKKDEVSLAPFPNSFKTLKASGTELVGKRYTLQVSVLDCTGCNACVEACPELPKALNMVDMEQLMQSAKENWEYAMRLPERGDSVQKNSVRGSQFQTPLMEFSGACSGCGETPYFKLLTQLFGERMLIANATGCSSIWGGSFPSNPYTASKKTGRGPAWANSLFEDNAEFGLGMFTATSQRRSKLVSAVHDFIHEYELRAEECYVNNEEKQLVSLLHDWLEIRDEKSDRPTLLFDKMQPLFKDLLAKKSNLLSTSPISRVWAERDMFPKLSQWICGGDGWAYDIGFGGLDHVEAFEANDVNVLVVDTEMYSNTGGQCSKSTPRGAMISMVTEGKQQRKKNLGEIFMTYEHVYVASVCLSNQSQVLQAFLEADEHNGPSIILAYAPCIQQGVRPQGLNDMLDECKFAVDSGYWPLYRYKPSLLKENKNPFILDSQKLRKDVTLFLQRESRFINLKKCNPVLASPLWEAMNSDVKRRMDHLLQLSAGYKSFESPESAKVIVLFASETGTAARIARDFADACTMSASASAMDDVELDEIDGKTTVFFVATCGQGAIPRNGKKFLKELNNRNKPFKEETKFMIFGLGDSSYFFYLKAARNVEQKLQNLGATRMLSLGEGDDSACGGFEAGLHDWMEKVWPILNLTPPAEVPHITPLLVSFSERALLHPEDDKIALNQYFHSDLNCAVQVPILRNDRMCRVNYDRDFRTIRIARIPELEYELGDAIDVFPCNDSEKVAWFLQNYSKDFGDHTVVKLRAFGIDNDISLGAIFTYVLDLFGKPSKHFIQQLATFETDEEERKIMLQPDFLEKGAKSTGVTIADILLRYNHAQPPLPALLSMIPKIKPRAYSIATSPTDSKNYIELLVLIDTWWCNEGQRVGLTCNMLKNLVEGDSLWCRVKTGSMEPPSIKQPVVCVGIGSGLAPHMAFLRDRVYAAEKGDIVQPFSLFFGNRNKEDEFLYQKELEEIKRSHDWFTLHVAFSRDDPNKKVYVQNLVARTDDARRLLRDNNTGRLYVCGNRNLPKPLQNALIESFSQRSKNSEDIISATAAMEDMFIMGRAQQEVW